MHWRTMRLLASEFARSAALIPTIRKSEHARSWPLTLTARFYSCGNVNTNRRGRTGALSIDEPATCGSHRRELVSQFLFFRFEISPRGIRRGDLQRKPFAHRQAVALDADELPRIVAQQPHRAD